MRAGLDIDRSPSPTMEQARSVLQSHEHWRQRNPVSMVASIAGLDRRVEDDGVESFTSRIPVRTAFAGDRALARRGMGHSSLRQPLPDDLPDNSTSSASHPFPRGREGHPTRSGLNRSETKGADIGAEEWSASRRHSSLYSGSDLRETPILPHRPSYQSTEVQGGSHRSYLTSSTNRTIAQLGLNVDSSREGDHMRIGKERAVTTAELRERNTRALLGQPSLNKSSEWLGISHRPDYQSTELQGGSHRDYLTSSTNRTTPQLGLNVDSSREVDNMCVGQERSVATGELVARDAQALIGQPSLNNSSEWLGISHRPNYQSTEIQGGSYRNHLTSSTNRTSPQLGLNADSSREGDQTRMDQERTLTSGELEARDARALTGQPSRHYASDWHGISQRPDYESTEFQVGSHRDYLTSSTNRTTPQLGLNIDSSREVDNVRMGQERSFTRGELGQPSLHKSSEWLGISQGPDYQSTEHQHGNHQDYATSSTNRTTPQLGLNVDSSMDVDHMRVGRERSVATGELGAHDTRASIGQPSSHNSSDWQGISQRPEYQPSQYGVGFLPGNSASSNNRLFSQSFSKENSTIEGHSTLLEPHVVTAGSDNGGQDFSRASVGQPSLHNSSDLHGAPQGPDHQGAQYRAGSHLENSTSGNDRLFAQAVSRDSSPREWHTTDLGKHQAPTTGADILAHDLPAMLGAPSQQEVQDLVDSHQFARSTTSNYRSSLSEIGSNVARDRVRDLAAEMQKAASNDFGLEHMWSNLEDRATQLSTCPSSVGHTKDNEGASHFSSHHTIQVGNTETDPSKMKTAGGERYVDAEISSSTTECVRVGSSYQVHERQIASASSGSTRERLQVDISSQPHGASGLARDSQFSLERRLHAMEQQLHLVGDMSRSSQECHAEASQLRTELSQAEDSRRSCLKERDALSEAYEERERECRELRQRLLASQVAARESGDASHMEILEHEELTQAFGEKLAEARQQLGTRSDAEYAARRKLACSLVLAERQLLAALHGPAGKIERPVASHLSKEVEATVARLNKAASDIALGAWENSEDVADGEPYEAVATAAVEQLSALAAQAIRSHREPPERCWHAECVGMTEAFAKMLSLGRTLARASGAVLKRMQRLASHIAAGRLVRCSKAGEFGKSMCVIWAGEWVPFNTELPNCEHAVAAWQQVGLDAQTALEKFQTGRAPVEDVAIDFVTNDSLMPMQLGCASDTATPDM